MPGPMTRTVERLADTTAEVHKLSGSMAAAIGDATDQLRVLTEQLTSGIAGEGMQGAAADQLRATAQAHLAALVNLGDLMNTVSGATGQCSETVRMIAYSADASAGNVTLLEAATAGLNLIAIAQAGIDPLSDVVALVADAAVGMVIQTFTAQLHEAISNCVRQIKSVGETLVQAHPPTNMQQVYDLIDAQYGTGQPIAITQVGPNRILVTLAGLEAGEWGQANNIPNALDAGLGDPNNPYAQDVRNAIARYISEHHLPPNTEVIIAGHSFGGIVAQQVADDAPTKEYHISEVITFGSPQVGPPSPTVKAYHQYATEYDAVPMLSWREDGGLVRVFGPVGGIVVLSLINQVPDAKHIFTGETVLKDAGTDALPSGWVGDDHGAYRYSQTLANTPVDFSIQSWGHTQDFGTTPQNPWLDGARMGGQFVWDELFSW